MKNDPNTIILLNNISNIKYINRLSSVKKLYLGSKNVGIHYYSSILSKLLPNITTSACDWGININLNWKFTSLIKLKLIKFIIYKY